MTDRNSTTHDSRERRHAAITSKYVVASRDNSGFDGKGNRREAAIPQNQLNAVSTRTAGVINDIDSIAQLLPDLELTTQILVSSVLSPKDLGEPKITISSETDVGQDELIGKLLAPINEFFIDDYKINGRLSDILTEALVKRGAYVEAIIPESALDKIINPDGRITLESLRSEIRPDFTVPPLGILNLRPKETNEVTLESVYSSFTIADSDSYKITKGISFSDNPDALKLPRVIRKINRAKIAERYNSHYSLEESKESKRTRNELQLKKLKGKTHQEISKALDTSRKLTQAENGIINLSDSSLEDSVGHPLIMKLPVESVVPVFSPGSPEDHLGYFVVIDQYGNPINLTAVPDHYRQIQDNLSKTSGESAISGILTELRGNTVGSIGTNSPEEAVRTFGSLMEKKMLKAISSGFDEESFSIGDTNNIYSLMLARALENKRTQVLYLPREMVSYVAFKYNTNGTGKSVLEDTRILGSLRVLMFINSTMASIRNSAARTELNITLDPTDTDPLSTISMVKDSFMRSRAEGYPLGEGSPEAIVRYLQRANVDVVYGSHPALPEMTIETTEKAVSRTIPDRELEERLRDWHIMAFGISPETVDLGRNAEFATSIVANNLLLSKRVVILQQKLEEKLEHRIRTHIRYSETLLSKLRKIIEESSAAERGDSTPEEILATFIRRIKVTLPKPDAATLAAKNEALQAYITTLEAGIEAYISSDLITSDTSGEMASHVEEIKAAVKASMIRRFMKMNNILPELDDMIDVGPDGKPKFDLGIEHSTHVESMMKSIEGYVTKAISAKAKRDKRLQDLEAKLGEADNAPEDEGASGGDEYSGDPDSGSEGLDEDGGAPAEGDEGAGDEGEEPAETEESEPAEEAPVAEETPEAEPAEEPEEKEEPEAEPEPVEEPAETEQVEEVEEPEEVEEKKAPTKTAGPTVDPRSKEGRELAAKEKEKESEESESETEEPEEENDPKEDPKKKDDKDDK